MGKVVAAGITVSVDGYIPGPDDAPGCRLRVGGERLHYWVFGGPWSYVSPGRGEPTGTDKQWLEDVLGANGAVITGRPTYEAAGHWGDKNPWGIPSSWSPTHPRNSRRARSSSSSTALRRPSTRQRRPDLEHRGGAPVAVRHLHRLSDQEMSGSWPD